MGIGKMKVSVVIPVYNAEQTIERLVQRLMAELALFELEIVLVNDCSADKSEKVCERLYRDNPEIVRFLSLAKNAGEHNAVMAGLRHSTGDFVVTMDDDFQNPPHEVTRLVQAAVQDEYDVVYSHFPKKLHSFYRNIGSWINDRAATLLLRKPADLYLSTFRVLSRFVVEEITKYQSPFPYVDGLILQVTDNIGSVEVAHNAREVGRSNYTLRKLISVWLNMFTSFSILPLRISVVLGVAVALLGFAYGVYSFVARLLNPDMVAGWASLTVTITIFSGIQLIAIGAIGEYIGRIFMAQNKKPQYTIRKKYISAKND